MGKIIVFDTVSDSIKADKLLQQNGFVYRIIPIPSSISSDCGMCVEVTESPDELIKCLQDNDFTIDIHDFISKEKK